MPKDTERILGRQAKDFQKGFRPIGQRFSKKDFLLDFEGDSPTTKKHRNNYFL
jgi:hypothetical protein